MTKRVTEAQGRKALRKASKDRQFSQGTPQRFAVRASDIVDLFAKYVEDKMPMPPNSGRGCRMTKEHIQISFGEFYQAIREWMDYMDGVKNE